MQTQGSSIRQFFQSRTGLVLLGFLAIAAFYLITEHTAHVFGVLPYVLLLLCPLLHLFLHRGHSGHGGRAGDDQHSDHVQMRDQNPHGGQHI